MIQEACANQTCTKSNPGTMEHLEPLCLPDCYSMRFTTLSNYYLIYWWCDGDFRLFACWFYFRFNYSYLTWETDGLKHSLTIILVLQANRPTKCASHPTAWYFTKILYYYVILPSGAFEVWSPKKMKEHQQKEIHHT